MTNKHFWAVIISVIIGTISALFPLSAKAVESNPKGDVNQDGVFNIADVILLQKWLLADENAALDNWENADFCDDDRLDVFDLCLMKKALIKAEQEIEFNADYDVFLSGYTEEVFKSQEENRIFTARSTNELKTFLSIYFEEEIIRKYEEKYTDKFFESHVLLLNVSPQSCGTKPNLEVTSVEYVNQSLNISMNEIKFDVAEDIISTLLIQVEISKYDYYAGTVKWQITGETVPPTTPVADDNKKFINVINISQYPELPTGCEVTSLTILLNHLGYQANKLDLARNYLPKQDFYWKNGIYYGADFRTTFAGNPESEYSYGCYAPCITTTANTYFAANGYSAKANNVTGTDFDNLLTDYIDNDIPVLIWITSNNLHETKLTSIWTTPAGEKVQWLAYEHCVVLTGYDKDNGLIYVSDPLVGNTSYDYSKIRQRYIDLGQQAVYIDMNTALEMLQ